MILFVVLLILIIAAPYLLELRRTPMNEAARADAPGRFVKLSQGTTHYEWFGPSLGPTLILIHGLTTPSFVWRQMARGLAGSGYRVLTYDLYGRGYSDRPAGAQDSAFFLRQLDDLLAHEKVYDDLTVVGYSMGGAIATCFASADPERIRQLVLLAPAGVSVNSSNLVRLIRNKPFLGGWLMRAVYPMVHRKGVRAERMPDGSEPEINPLQLAELKTRGYIPAVLSSMRGILAGPLDQEHKVLDTRGVRVMAIWGEKDDLIPLSAVGVLAEWNHDTNQEVIPGAGHGLPYTHSDAVLDVMRGWMKPPPFL